MRVIDTLWFTNAHGTIGIITIEEDITGNRKAYIGSVSGSNEKEDTQQIIDWGNPFSLDTALRLTRLLAKKKKK